ncbi:pyridoxal-phosphate-dependent aminotransferase family protein [Pararhodobacter zhoushanensis]|uniref:Aminotransferase class V-fold PLP-dependent enzyme n=1 Tax=Pararhodobacter zhoushanensis TaxID=2479545 RepID=A0ABT3H3F0_9RHOB|nr:aminotransferase class V-fold PLP-dependent enzyme [Pararhodobacter zhoushanensis]MCW1934341.1 aminotransferase class V-fold PLP-dependent enzyme [Pararhodobacter zhoushanensis]
MSLANGRQYLAIPGPSVMPDRVLNAMHKAAPNIYEGELTEMVGGLRDDLKAVARTRQNLAIYIGNGHATWEAANANTFSRGDTAIVLATGRFGHGWAENARQLGVTTAVTDFGKASPIDLERAEAALRANPDARAVMVTHMDTATSVRNDVAMVRKLMDDLGHPGLLMVDCIASLACDQFEMDDWGVDVMIAASQKGLMTPPGLGFVFFSDKAKAAGKSSDLRSPYWDWTPRNEAQFFYENWYGTAPTHHLLGLREALTMLHEEGIQNVWARHTKLASAVWAAAEAWGTEGAFRLNIADPAHRGHSVTAVRLSGDDGTRLRRWTEFEAGVTLGIGLGMTEPGEPGADAFFRIAHMGHVNAHMTLGALAVIDTGMKVLGIPHGPGALDAAAAALASA